MKRKHTPWSRRAKITRNLLLFLLLSLTVWTQLGKPLPYGLAVRRAARQHLIPETDHHANVSLGLWGGYFRIDWTEGVAMTSRYIRPGARLTYFYDPDVIPCRLPDGPSLLFSPWSLLLAGEGPSLTQLYAVYAAIFPPEDSVTADLTLRNGAGTFTASAEKETDHFVFYVKPEPDENGRTSVGGPAWSEYTYELTFYDGTGRIVSEAAG